VICWKDDCQGLIRCYTIHVYLLWVVKFSSIFAYLLKARTVKPSNTQGHKTTSQQRMT
jgi:hypothetical protein